jgi:hypothetical protein
MEGKLLFYYFGDDEAYFRTVIGEFKKVTPVIISFRRFFETDEKKIQSFFLKIFTDKPDCVLIDFSKHSQDYVHLARILSRSKMQHKFITVGVVDYLSPHEILKEGIATGVDLTFIKSVETYDVAYHVTKLLELNQGEHGFAVADLKEEWEGGLPIKIGFVHSEGIHFETDFKLQKGDKIVINHDFIRLKILPSRKFFISEVSSTNLFYHFKYAVDAEFLFVDEYLPPEGASAEEVEEKRKERDELVIYHKKLLLNWINKNQLYSLEKKAKVLIIDRDFHVYDNQPRSDKTAYTIRCLPFFEEMENEINIYEPQVIASAMDNEEMSEPKNTNEQLSNLLVLLKDKFSKQPPFIIVFNTKVKSKEMKENFQYPHIMASENQLSADLLARMAEVFDKKLENSLKNIKQRFKHSKIFLSKTNATSLGEIVLPITVTKISETDLIFQSEVELPIGTNLRLISPVDMYVNVRPSKNQSKKPEYCGLIHSIGEDDKKTLRRFVNAIFFRDHDAQIEAEIEEFKKINQKKMEEIQQALEAAKLAEAQKSEKKEES